MLKLKLNIPSNVDFKLYIGRDKKGLYGDLKYVSLRSPDKSLLINNFRDTDFKEIDLEPLENTTIDVNIKGNSLYYQDKEILQTENIFRFGLLLNLFIYKGRVFISLGDLKLKEISLNDVPKDLFIRRKLFKLRVIGIDEYEIVRYANLHQHTEYSLLDGIVKVKDLAAKTENACAITDHGNMSGVLDFYKAMKAQNKTPIIGVEAYVESVLPFNKFKFKEGQDNTDVLESMFDSSSDGGVMNSEHLILLAKNENGMHNLFKLVSMAEKNIYKKPHVKIEWLKEYGKDIVATSACIAGTLGSSIMRRIGIRETVLKNLYDSYGDLMTEIDDIPLSKDEEKAMKIYKEALILEETYINTMIDIFGKDDFYLELQDHHFELENKVMSEIKEYAKRYNLKKTVGIDAHYLNKEDAEIHELWLCLQTQTNIDDPKRMRFSGDGYYVHTSDEVVELFKDDLDALDNTLEIADKCTFEISHHGYSLPVYPVPEGYKDDAEYFKKLCIQKFKEKFKGTDKINNKVYRDRLIFEVNTILKMGWPSYFLIVQDFIAYAKDTKVAEHLDLYFPKNHYNQDEIPDYIKKDFKVYVGPGRGSAAGSLVCYCLGITDLDPIKYDLLFER